MELKNKGIHLIGIFGKSCSGKSSLIEEACRGLDGILAISQDDYYNGIPEKTDALSYNFDSPEALDNELLLNNIRCLMQGEKIRAPIYDFKSHRRVEYKYIDPGRLIIIEGTMLMAIKPLRELFSYVVYIYCSDEEIFKRRILRDVLERGRRPEEVIAYYNKYVLNMSRKYIEPFIMESDLVLRNESAKDFRKNMNVLKALFKEFL